MTTKLTNIKMFKGRDGYGLNATLLVDAIKVANIHDAADGGAYSYDILDVNKWNEFTKELAKCPPVFVEMFGEEMQLDKDTFICLLHDAQVSGKPFNVLA